MISHIVTGSNEFLLNDWPSLSQKTTASESDSKKCNMRFPCQMSENSDKNHISNQIGGLNYMLETDGAMIQYAQQTTVFVTGLTDFSYVFCGSKTKVI